MRSPDQPGRNGSPTMPFDLKRSGSHPHINMEQPLSSADDEAKMASAVEKKRSKLNYHRASTACSKQRTPHSPTLSFPLLLFRQSAETPVSFFWSSSS